jgi:exosortase
MSATPESTPSLVNATYWKLASACGAALMGVMVWSYWPTLQEVVAAWNSQPDYSHGFLVAPLAVLFLWLRRNSYPAEHIYPSVAGLAVLLGVCALRILAGRYFLQPLDAWTIPLWTAGATWMLLGGRSLRWALPSIVFLWFMFPIPFTAESWLSVPLQAIATKLSTATLVMLGQPALSEGNTIWVGDHPHFVEEACSGLRIFVGIFALAFAFVLFSRWAWWQKGLALMAALPVAIVANVGRIVGTALLYELVSSEAAQKFSHDIAGFVMIPVAAAIFWAFWVFLERLFPEVELVSPVARIAAQAGS